MELREFIKETIIQIADGVRGGHDYIVENQMGDGVRMDKAKEITFDIAVASNEEGATEKGGKIVVAQLFNAGASTSKSSSNMNTNRIQFKLLVHVKT